MKPYVQILKSIDKEFQENHTKFTSDPLFSSSQIVYTDDDKRRIGLLWWDLVQPFLRLRKLLRSLIWRSFFILGNKESFVVKYAIVTTYYSMVYELQKSFGPHEEFLRQYLDDTFTENYSTLARYMYHIRFYSILVYPYEYFLTLRDEVDSSLGLLFDRPVYQNITIERRWSHDLINIWYYIRYRLSLLLSWISKYGGRMMMHIRLTRRTHGLITWATMSEFQKMLFPGDILVTRGNWSATNLNIPGFWKHMAMYIGTGKYIKDHFTLKTGLELKDDIHYIIEAVWVWVQIIPIATLCGHNDYIGALRTRFSSGKIERAIQKTLLLYGKSYDYSFNYYSDVNYVCSTLVTKAYLKENTEDEWINITLTRIATGITYPPNDIVKKYKQEFWKPNQELDFVAFIDSIEKTGDNFLAREEDFRASGERPKLSFFLP